jgi:subtilisin family serine protease
VSVELYRPAGATDFELCVEDLTAGREVGRARTSAAADRCGPAVGFLPEPGHRYALRVRQTEGGPGSFHVVVLGGGLRYTTAPGSIPFPGDGPEVIAVGAVDQQGRRLAYSSCGPNSSRPKPDLVAPVPFPSGWRARSFTGTSAAAPQAAALAALLWSRHPDWTARQVRQGLQDAARHTGPAPHDRETGFGEVHLP